MPVLALTFFFDAYFIFIYYYSQLTNQEIYKLYNRDHEDCDKHGFRYNSLLPILRLLNFEIEYDGK